MIEFGQLHTRATRYKELGYTRVDATDWRFVDLTDPAHLATVGPRYRSRTELLADLDRYASVFGACTYLMGTRFKNLPQTA